ncbi:MAG: exosortase H [Thermoanaerobaculum sp.]
MSERFLALWREPAARFVLLFAAWLTVLFLLLALKPVNDQLVEPYTAFIAQEAAVVLRLFGVEAHAAGMTLSSPRFSVAIYNGCNGLEASIVLFSGILAFPSRWRWKALGVVFGLLVIHVVNLVRVLSLFGLGMVKREWFSTFHNVIWQVVIVVLAVALLVVWAQYGKSRALALSAERGRG